MPNSRMSIGANLTMPEGNDSQSDHDSDLDDISDSDTAEIMTSNVDWEVSSESDEDSDEWKGRLNLHS